MSKATVYVVVCQNYDDTWICGCFVDDEEKAETLRGQLEKDADSYRSPGNDPHHFVEAWEDGVGRKPKEAVGE